VGEIGVIYLDLLLFITILMLSLSVSLSLSHIPYRHRPGHRLRIVDDFLKVIFAEDTVIVDKAAIPIHGKQT